MFRDIETRQKFIWGFKNIAYIFVSEKSGIKEDFHPQLKELPQTKNHQFIHAHKIMKKGALECSWELWGGHL